MKIIIDSFVPFAAEALAPYAELKIVRGDAVSAADTADADAMIIRTRTKCNAALLHDSRVKFIGTATIGYDHIDLAYCNKAGIEVVSAAGCNARAVLQWFSAMLVKLSAEKGLTPAQTTLGVVGVGHVGSLIAEYAAAWGFRVLCSDPPRERAERLGRSEGFVPLDELAAESDILTFHTPLSSNGEDATYHLGGSELFSHMKDGAAVVNASRGEVVDNEAIAANLDRLTFCIDTWEGEPRNLDRTILSKALVATPHIAGYSRQGKANASSIVVRALAHWAEIKELKDWYPKDVNPSCPRPISWKELQKNIKKYCDLDAETALLKGNPDNFENRRDSYPLREEFF